MASPTPGTSGTRRRALIVCTASNALKKTNEPTGCWLEEVAAPYSTWTSAGYHVDITTPGGAPVPWDPASLEEGKLTPECHAFMRDEMAQQKVKTPLSLGKVTNAADYSILFLAGGHGCMMDFPENKTLNLAISSAVKGGNRVIAAVCHGVAGLLHVTDPRTGKLLLADKRACGFTNDEEKELGKTKAVPFALESAIVKAGARFEKGAPWSCNVVRDGLLVTGQNPQSSKALAEECLRVADELANAPETPRGQKGSGAAVTPQGIVR
jgi:putative intracellular protease/amidase